MAPAMLEVPLRCMPRTKRALLSARSVISSARPESAFEAVVASVAKLSSLSAESKFFALFIQLRENDDEARVSRSVNSPPIGTWFSP
jgi:hypothetical protein